MKKILALILAMMMLLAFAACDKKSDSSSDSKSDSKDSVASVVKEYTDDYIDYWELGGYKSLYKISADGAYYQIYTANAKIDSDQKATLLACVTVYKDHIDDFEYGIFDDEDALEREKNKMIDEAKEYKEYIIEELEELVEFYEDD